MLHTLTSVLRVFFNSKNKSVYTSVIHGHAGSKKLSNIVLEPRIENALHLISMVSQIMAKLLMNTFNRFALFRECVGMCLLAVSCKCRLFVD